MVKYTLLLFFRNLNNYYNGEKPERGLKLNMKLRNFLKKLEGASVKITLTDDVVRELTYENIQNAVEETKNWAFKTLKAGYNIKKGWFICEGILLPTPTTVTNTVKAIKDKSVFNEDIFNAIELNDKLKETLTNKFNSFILKEAKIKLKNIKKYEFNLKEKETKNKEA